MSKNEISNFILKNFPNSNINAILFEIESKHKITISTFLGFENLDKIKVDVVIEKANKIFSKIFCNTNDPILVLINHWDNRCDLLMLNQFEKYKKNEFWSNISIDETQGTVREQYFIKSPLKEINFNTIFSILLYRCNNLLNNDINSRVFFIEPTKMIYFLYFDHMIEIGGNCPNSLTVIYNKCYQYMTDTDHQNNHSLLNR